MNRPAFSALAQRTQDPPITWLMQMALDRPGLISLAAGFTDNASLPVEETRALLEALLASPKIARPALQYGSTEGDGALRSLTSERIRQQDGLLPGSAAHAPERLLITHGSQQMLYLATECLCDEGDMVLVEDPTYFVYLGILQSRGIQCRGIPLENDGIAVEALDKTLRSLQREGRISRVKMLYLVSYFQNPTGTTTRFEKKKAILRLLRRYEKAAGHPLYLLEDAAYRDLRFAGPDEPSALADESGASRVLYAGTFSKPFATGIRVGFGILPKEIFRVVARFKGNHDFGTSNLLQQVLRQALESGLYDQHLQALQRRYGKKADLMAKSIQAHFPEQVQWREPKGGLYIWTGLPRRVRTGPKSKLFQEALRRDVLYVPGELCYGPDTTRRAPAHEMRLSFGSAVEENIEEGIRRLGKAIVKQF